MTAKNYPTKARLRELFDYDAETGIFTRAITLPGTRHKAGQVAGCTASCGYIYMRVDNGRFLAHRLAWIYSHCRIPDEIDHINGVRADNRLANLRDVSCAEQNRNKALNCNNSSGVTGVSWYKNSAKWLARIGVGGNRVCLGYFATKADAIAARKEAEHSLGFHPNHGRLPRAS